MTTKTKEELEAERKEALENINQILDSTRPKGLGEGVSSGVSNILQGAVGAVGVAVLLPTLGLAAGVQKGGILGGVVGVTAGAIAGALGAAALAVGGAISGVSQIVRGVVAVPQQIIAPRQGKWWNENEGHWVLTKMEEEAKILEDVPEDDDDILGKIKENLDASFKLSKGDGAGTEVVDMYYYEILEVTSDADQATLKRRYYTLARQYHPDKVGVDDKESADKFKDIAEAYQVLSDPALRDKYNKDGRDGLSADKTDVAAGMANMDSDMLFAFLFGSDLFYDYVGRLATATSASIGDSPEVSVQDARKLQKRRVTRLALNLITKISPWISQVHAGAADGEALEAGWKDEAIELSKASFGFELVTTIGKAYNLVAIMFEGSNEGGQGLPNVSKWAQAQRANLDAKNAANKNKVETMKATIDMMKVQAELKQKMADAKTDEEKEKIAIELQEASVGILLRVLWTTTVVDITSTIYETCQMLFYDQSVDKETRKLRGKAIKALGKIWMEIPDPDGGTKTKDAKQLYEEAAFAAMLETVKRKDEKTHGQMSHSQN